jgi:hypothetical protein
MLTHAVAEKTFLDLRDLACETPNANFIAISHSSPEATEKWLIAIGGVGAPPNDDIQVIVDDSREIYAKYGLGTSSAWHVLNPLSMWDAVTLGKTSKIWNRPTESGTRWQTAGSFAVDGEGTVRWVDVATQASHVPDFHKAIGALEAGKSKL